MDKKEFKKAMKTIDKSLDLMLQGDFRAVDDIIMVTETLIVDARYPRKWFDYYASYSLHKLYRRFFEKYGSSRCYGGNVTAKLMQARKHELEGNKDYKQLADGGNFWLDDMEKFATKNEVETVRVLCRELGELAYKNKKIITIT